MSQINRPTGSLFYKAEAPQPQEIRKKRWNIWGIIGKAIKRTCMIIGAMVLFSSLLSVILISTTVKTAAPSMPKDMVLVLKLDQGIAELPDQPSFTDIIPKSRPTMRQLTQTLNAAAADSRVKAVIVTLKGGGLSLGHIQEFRDAIKRFQGSGKKAYFYTSSFADSGSSMGGYYLASAFDEIWMQPVGMLAIAGFSMEMPFLKNVLDKVGVRPQFLQREEYKGAVESFTHAEMTDASRESLAAVIKTYGDVASADIIADRGISRDDLMTYVNRGLLGGQAALDAKLIDHLNYGDVLVSSIRENITGDGADESLELISFTYYGGAQDGAGKVNKASSGKENIALIYVAGTIQQSGTRKGVASAEDISLAISDARENSTIDTIIVRVDSPGGSPSASETIRRAIVRAKDEGKQVIISMGNLAASGGYWVSADADQIFAYDTTLTGSIGVVMGKFEMSGLWDKVGANWESVDWGQSAGLWSMNQPFSDNQLANMNTLIESTYQAFLSRVAQGRGMSVEEVRSVAKGRVWTGRDAQTRGLVDRIGGLHDALSYVAAQKGLASVNDLNVVVLPKPKTRVEQFIELFGIQANLGAQSSRLSTVLEQADFVFDRYDQAKNPQLYLTYNADLDMMR